MPTSRQVSQGPHLITTSPSVTICSECRREVLAATVGGLDRHVDPVPLNDLGELQAVLRGVRTYELHSEILVRRGVERIRKGSLPSTPVLPEHTHHPVPGHLTDHRHLAQAIWLCKKLLGATVLPGSPDYDGPPPF
jgi:hypothetical protein